MGEGRQKIPDEGYIWLIWYGISHGRNMHISIHQGSVPSSGFQMGLSYVSSFHGDLEGGPYRISLREEGGGWRLRGEPIEAGSPLEIAFAEWRELKPEDWLVQI